MTERRSLYPKIYVCLRIAFPPKISGSVCTLIHNALGGGGGGGGGWRGCVFVY